MLNRVWKLARRQGNPAGRQEDPGTFPPRKRAMGTTFFGQPDPEAAELDTSADDQPGGPPLASPEQPMAAAPQAGQDAPPLEVDGTPVQAAPSVSAATSLGGLTDAAPSDMSAEGAELPLEQMSVAVEDGLVMVFGPEGDPVPPYAFAAAAATHPDALVGLPDGTKARASRIARVLGAQVLGRLGTADQGAEWILAMLRDGDGPEEASDDALGAEHDVLGAIGAALAGAAGGSGVAAPGAPDALDQITPDDHEPARADGLEDLRATPADEDREDQESGRDQREAPEQALLDRLFAAVEPGADASSQRELDVEEAAVADLDLDSAANPVDVDSPGEPGGMPAPTALADPRHAASPPMVARPDGDASDPGAAGSGAGLEPAGDRTPSMPVEPAAGGEAAAERTDIDPDSMVLVVMRGVPEDAWLSAGVRDEDGSWSISPLDLPTVTISLAPHGEGVGEARSGDGDLSITGIALAENGELVAISETVPLADYLGDPVSGDPDPTQGAATPSDEPGTIVHGPRVIPLEVDPQIWAGETFDALVIRELPAGVRLSAGAYDPAIDGWVLRPQELAALAILPPSDRREDFSLTLLGITLRQADANAVRVLVRLPVRLA